jgi:hypothetical protein
MYLRNTKLLLAGILVLELSLVLSLTEKVLSENVDESGGVATLELKSSPEGAEIMFDKEESGGLTPTIFKLDPGLYKFELSKPGYESLPAELRLVKGKKFLAEFILKETRPAAVTPESLGLFILPLKQQVDPKMADRLNRKFKVFGEVFAIIPLGQGLIARFIVDDDEKDKADIMIVSGAILSAGSFILGKILSNRKRKKIEAENLAIPEENKAILLQNKEVGGIVQEANDKALSEWAKRNDDKGKVKITEKTP